MKKFTTHTMLEILTQIQQRLQEHHSFTFEVLHPERGECYAGSTVKIHETTYLYRSLKSWMDLAELLHCKMSLSQMSKDTIIITYTKLSSDSFHRDYNYKEKEKYGVDSTFAKIHKIEEPAFIYYYIQALHNVKVAQRSSILNLGVNRGDEFLVIKNLLDIDKYQNLSLTGIDHSQSAVAYAKKLFREDKAIFYTHDITKIDTLNLDKFDLLISIGTLQSSSIPFKPFFMKLVQNYLKKNAAIILGFPNSRWIGGEMIYGSKAPNYTMSEMSLVCNDIQFCKKYLQQKKFRVTVTGKHYLFLTATKIH